MTKNHKEFCNIADCISEVNEQLKAKVPNVELATTLGFADTGESYLTILLPLAKINTKIRGRIPHGLTCTYCPFCGGKSKK